LQTAFPDAHPVGRAELDLTDSDQVRAWPWHSYDVVLNAAAFTGVDKAESPEGRRAAWALNASAPALLAEVTREHRLTLVHFSSDYVFDGTAESYDENAPLSPLGVYGQSKAAGDLAVAGNPRHYILRSSWVVGDGPNFVRTMLRLAQEGQEPSVVDDQRGRLTFSDELARAVRHLISVRAPFGTYNCTGDGPVVAWADIAEAVFTAVGHPTGAVRRVSSEEFGAGKSLAPRPRNSTLDLTKIRGTGFEPEVWSAGLTRYLAR
jgi:dTDP-4-dehydrorhamnose 3,5-epimerase